MADLMVAWNDGFSCGMPCAFRRDPVNGMLSVEWMNRKKRRLEGFQALEATIRVMRVKVEILSN